MQTAIMSGDFTYGFACGVALCVVAKIAHFLIVNWKKL